MYYKYHLLHFWLYFLVFMNRSCECKVVCPLHTTCSVKGNFLRVSTPASVDETINSKLKPKNNDVIESHSSYKKNRAPTFKREWNDPDPMYVHEFAAKKFSLNCSVKGRPRPRVKWYKNNHEILNGADRPGSSSAYDFDNKRHLVLKVADSHPKDSGNYTCVASNSQGTIQRFFIVEIEGRASAQEPKILPGNPENKTLLIGEQLRLECRIANEDPRAPSEIYWTKQPQESVLIGDSRIFWENKTTDGKKVPKFWFVQRCDSGGNCLGENGDKENNYNIGDPQIFVVDNVTLEETGYYCCGAKNPYGVDLSCSWINIVKEFPDNTTNAKIIIGSVISTGIILIFAFILILYYALNQKKKRKEMKNAAREVVLWAKRVTVTTDEQRYDNSNGSTEVQEPKVTIQRCRMNYSESGHYNSSYPPDYSEYEFPYDTSWELDREKIKILDDTLGEGAFGLVKKAKYQGRTVAVKMLKEGHTDQDVIDLVKEMTIMKQIKPHDHILQLIGVCTQPRGFHLQVVVEYARFGDLRNFLQERQSNLQCVICAQGYMEPVLPLIQQKKCEISCILTLDDQLKIAWQVAKGMEFLHFSKCIHRDLAARNVLVFEDNKVKISDFGFARCIEDTEYYRKISEGKLPVKWMAPEAIFERKFTTQSDIWSFGVLLWEIITMGDSPYKHDPPKLYFEKLRDGNHLEQPWNCSDDVYEIMEQCWRYYPNDRPSWNILIPKLQNLVLSYSQPYKYTEIIV